MHATDSTPHSPRRGALAGGLVVLVVIAAGLVLPSEVTAAVDARPRLSWPLEPEPQVTRPFDPPERQYGTGHRGVDLAARPGQPVLAADAGVVIFAGELAGRGVISIQHDGRMRTTYEPLRPVVREGSRVYRGQIVGRVARGHPECSGVACLHWGALRQREYVNPLVLVRTDVAIRLKPWDGRGSGSSS